VPLVAKLVIAVMLLVIAVAAIIARRQPRPSPPPPVPPGPPPDEAELVAVFGREAVASCQALTVEPGVEPQGNTFFGGEPRFLESPRWPACRTCQEPMTFIGQVERGEGVLFIFLCSSNVSDEPCQSWDPRSGASACFVQPGGLAAIPPRPPRHRETQVQLQERYAVTSRPGLSVRAGDGHHDLRARARATTGDVQIGGFGDWIQDEIVATCSCGAPMELLLQLEAFDDHINLGDSGRAYVLGCSRRHAADAFELHWQCC
jgi:hypothetical protein